MRNKTIALFIMLFVFYLNAETIKDADDLFSKAQTYYNAKNFPESIKCLNNALLIYEKFEPENKANRGTIDIWLGSSYYSMNQIENSIKYFNEAVDIFSKNNDNQSLLMAINGISNAYLAKKDYEKIIYYYKIAASMYDTLKDIDSKGVYLTYIGSYYYQLKKYNESIDYYSKAVENYKQNGNIKEVFNNLNNIGGIYFYSGDKEKSVGYYKLAYETGSSFLTKADSIQYLNSIASIYQDLKKYNDATEYFLKIEKIEKELNNANDLAIAYYNMSLNYFHSGKKELAANYYKLAGDTGKNVIDENQKITYLNKIAEAAEENKDYQTALDSNIELSKIYEKNKSLKDLATVYNNISIYYSKNNDFDLAVTYCKKAESLALNSNDPELTKDIYYDLGYFYIQSKKYNESLFYNNKFLNSNTLNDSRYIGVLNNVGYCYLSIYDMKNSEIFLLKAETLAVKSTDKELLLSTYENIANLYHQMDNFQKAYDYYNKALDLSDKLNKKDRYAVMLCDLGGLYGDVEYYDKAIECLTKSMEINKTLGNDDEIATIEGNFGHIYYLMSKYDIALKYMNQSLDYVKNHGDRERYASTLNNIGELYRIWGKPDKAIEYYNNSMKIAKELNSTEMLETLYHNYGLVNKDKGDYSKSIDYFTKALEINRRISNKSGIALNLSNMGDTYRLIGEFDKSMRNFYSAFEINKELGLRAKAAICLNNISILYSDAGYIDKSIEYLNDAISISETNNKLDLSIFYFNMGGNYNLLKQYDKAIEWFQKSILLKEELRKTAPADLKIDYLSSQINTYQALIYSYNASGNTRKALETAELSRSKYLTERISDKFKINTSGDFIESVKKNLDKDSIIISLSNISETFKPVRIIINGNDIVSRELDGSKLVMNEKEFKEIKNSNENSGEIGFTKNNKDLTGDERIYYDRLKNMIFYYRTMLKKPDVNFLENRIAVKISRALYDYFFGDIDDIIKDKKKIVIIPDNILGMLPFETLLDGNRKFLVEKYDIKYANSLNLLNILKERKFDNNRLSLLAFGGAVYEKDTYKEEMAMNVSEYNRLIKDSINELNRKVTRSSNVYGFLKNATWQNLPGTLAEVKSIGKIYLDSQINTGEQVSEKNVKDLSVNGKLKKYRIIHFATHGLIVPESPELSAIVLSLSDKVNSNEDGFLQSKDIANLDLNADFVNLSACETGLGKIYGGEGLVGLTQSFLIAGANGVSVSLWEVDDQSTMIFMTELYRLQKEGKMSFYEAESQVKREFIQGKKYTNPYYWAPFVYYGL